MKLLLSLLLLAVASFAATDSVTVSAVDGSTLTSPYLSFGRAFADGEFATGQCAQPVISGTPVTNWQNDIKARWADGSIKYAIVSLIPPSVAVTGTTITFQSVASSSACDGTAGLTQLQMTNYDTGGGAGSWDGQMLVTANGVTKTVDAKTNLGALSIADCQLTYWLKGPVITQAIVQDCSSTMQFDFGAHYTGGVISQLVLTGNGTSGCTTGNTVSITDSPPLGQTAGTGASFTATVAGGVVTGFTRTSGGSGYIEPVVTIAQGACATTPAAPQGIVDDSGMAMNVGAWYTGTSTFASLRPSFILTFLGASGNPVKIDFVMWNGKTTTGQDQNYSFVLKTGATPAQVYTSTGQIFADSNGIFDHPAGTYWRKTFWSGTAGGAAPYHFRIDHNFDYLVSTKLIPNYDLTGAVKRDPYTDYTTWNSNTQTCPFGAGIGRRGDLGGCSVLESVAYDSNNEGAPLREPDLDLLYNMSASHSADGSDCSTQNGLCAKAWAMMFGEVDARAGTTVTGCSGGCGYANGMANVPFHMVEGRTSTSGGNQTGTNFYDCPSFFSKDAVANATTCGNTDGFSAIGRPLSRHAHSDTQIAQNVITMTGAVSYGYQRWDLLDCSHWIDYSYIPYLLTGDYVYYSDVLQQAAFCITNVNPTFLDWGGNGIFGFVNGSARQIAWSLQELSRAADMAVSGSPEATYFQGMLDSNLEILEGAMSITGTSLTPTSRNPAGTTYTQSAANRWDWGRLSYMSLCDLNAGSNCPVVVIETLHNFHPGNPAWGANANGGFGFGSGGGAYPIISSTSPVNGTTRFTVAAGTGMPVAGDVVSIAGGQNCGAGDDWTGVNANYTAANVTASTFDISFDSHLLGALCGAVYGWEGGFGIISTATSANPSQLTGNKAIGTVAANGVGIDVDGAVNQSGTNWAGLNAWWATPTSTGANTFTVPLNATGFPAFSQGAVYFTTVSGMRWDKDSDFQESWMENYFRIVMGELIDQGFTHAQSVATEVWKGITEALTDTTFNPYLAASYFRPIKAGTLQAGTGGSSTASATANPFLSTWAAVLGGFSSAVQATNTFDPGEIYTTACDDHSYQLALRAAAASADSHGNITGTCGASASCTSDAAWTWTNAHVPFFNNTPTGSTGCGTSQVQIKFAITAAALTSTGTPTVRSSGFVSAAGTIN